MSWLGDIFLSDATVSVTTPQTTTSQKNLIGQRKKGIKTNFSTRKSDRKDKRERYFDAILTGMDNFDGIGQCSFTASWDGPEIIHRLIRTWAQ